MISERSLLKVANLNAWYGESHVIHGLSLHVTEGEIVTLLGRNGVGKTTTLRAIMGVIRKRTGTIQFDGADISNIPLHLTAYRGLGYIPEERGIFSSLTVEENLVLPPLTGQGGMTVEELYDFFPNLAERRKSQGTKLSGGEQQMLAIARILRTGAKMLLLDEPTEGLAPVIVDKIGDLLSTLRKRDMTILLVEQNLRFARELSDRCYVVEHGQIADEFPVSEFDVRMDGLKSVLGV